MWISLSKAGYIIMYTDLFLTYSLATLNY
ncbi:hypothetical protein PSEUDO8O_80096 [Pseudomonas sp. 8O]|nr:hypothetical protein PSEUDO8O_80096 [Pseudomonas sp. 8O]